MAGPVYSNLVMSLLRGNNDLVDITPSAFTTDLPVNTVAFRLMGWLSMVCASVLFVEQYFCEYTLPRRTMPSAFF
jgi:lipid-A-disaccharide synthase-like uncharacterized protein